MPEIKDYPSLVDAVYKIVLGAADQEQIDIASVANALDIPWDSKACVSGIVEAIGELVNLGYCKGFEEFEDHYRCISRSPDAPDTLPSGHPNPYAVHELHPLR